MDYNTQTINILWEYGGDNKWNVRGKIFCMLTSAYFCL